METSSKVAYLISEALYAKTRNLEPVLAHNNIYLLCSRRSNRLTVTSFMVFPPVEFLLLGNNNTTFVLEMKGKKF